MATRDEVERFLESFKIKLKIHRMIFRDDRGKNAQALAELEITPVYREEVIKKIMHFISHRGASDVVPF